jgi:hypothetical protein
MHIARYLKRPSPVVHPLELLASSLKAARR